MLSGCFFTPPLSPKEYAWDDRGSISGNCSDTFDIDWVGKMDSTPSRGGHLPAAALGHGGEFCRASEQSAVSARASDDSPARRWRRVVSHTISDHPQDDRDASAPPPLRRYC